MVSPNTPCAGVLVVGRIVNSSGNIVNCVLEGHVNLAISGVLEGQHLIQGTAGLNDLPAGMMDSTENVVKIPRLLHEEVSAEYGRSYEDTGKSLREWLSTQPYDVRRAKGIEVMRKLGIIK